MLYQVTNPKLNILKIDLFLFFNETRFKYICKSHVQSRKKASENCKYFKYRGRCKHSWIFEIGKIRNSSRTYKKFNNVHTWILESVWEPSDKESTNNSIA